METVFVGKGFEIVRVEDTELFKAALYALCKRGIPCLANVTENTIVVDAMFDEELDEIDLLINHPKTSDA